MKYTLLPPQPAPKQLTAHRNAGNLGEHRRAFMNANNPHGFPEEPVPEEPVSEELAALFTTTLTNAPKLSKAERKRGLAEWNHKLIMAGYVKKDGVWVKRESVPVEEYLRRLTPLQQYEKARNDPKWQQPWNHAAYHESLTRKHIYATRNFSEPVTRAHDDEYRSRLDKLLAELDQQSNIKNPVLREFVNFEKASAVLASRKFSYTVGIQEFMDSVLSPKSEPTGHHRINPYLNN